MCRKTIYRTYGAGTLRRMVAIDMLLLWSKVRVLVVVLNDMRSTQYGSALSMLRTTDPYVKINIGFNVNSI